MGGTRAGEGNVGFAVLTARLKGDPGSDTVEEAELDEKEVAREGFEEVMESTDELAENDGFGPSWEVDGFAIVVGDVMSGVDAAGGGEDTTVGGSASEGAELEEFAGAAFWNQEVILGV